MRPAEVILPVLRSALPDALVVSVVPDVDQRTYPMVCIERSGGTRSENAPRLLALSEVDITVVSADGLIAAEELYEDALDALYDALPGVRETQGATEVESKYPDTWAVEGTIRVRVRR
ncbi:hypothetical protein [Mycolicibacterium sp. PDY-3]|uniref:hypothetical protein n=1 Tax=Mycolicibacterium sp. PDY-3 TaxID=3376069 RepID=UPI0037A693A7